MAATTCEELWTGRRGSDTLDRQLRFVRVFEVYTDDPNDDANVAAAHVDVPRNGDLHPTVPEATMTAIDADNADEDPLRWIITCVYTTSLAPAQAAEVGGYDPATGAAVENDGGGGGGTTDRAENPLDRPPTVRVDWETVTEIFEKDVDGNDVVNSAGDPFDPPAEVERSYRVITISKNYAPTDAVLDFDTQDDYQDCVNDDVWAGRAAGTARLTIQSLEYLYENDIAFGRVTYRIKIRPQTWAKFLLDRGRRDINGIWFEREDGTGIPRDEPANLDGLGEELAQGDPLVFIPFEPYPPRDFGALGI